jgi:hypothetical protein
MTKIIVLTIGLRVINEIHFELLINQNKHLNAWIMHPILMIKYKLDITSKKTSEKVKNDEKRS